MRNLKLNLTIVTVLLVVLIILVFFTEGAGELVNILKNMRYIYIAVAFLCTVLFWMGEALIFHTTLNCLSYKQKWSSSVKVSMIGKFFEAVTPFGTGGNAAQGYVIIKDGVKPGHAILTVIIKSLTFQIVIVFYTVIVLIFKADYFLGRIPHFRLLVGLGLAVNILVLFSNTLFFFKKSTAARIIVVTLNFLKKIRIIRKPMKYKNIIFRELILFNEGFAIIKAKPMIVICTLLYQVIRLTIFFSVPFFIFYALENSPPVYMEIVSSQAVLTTIVSFIPLPGASIGTEGIGYLFFKLIFRERTVLSVILIWRLITYYSKIFFGSIYALTSSEKPLENET